MCEKALLSWVEEDAGEEEEEVWFVSAHLARSLCLRRSGHSKVY